MKKIKKKKRIMKVKKVLYLSLVGFSLVMAIHSLSGSGNGLIAMEETRQNVRGQKEPDPNNTIPENLKGKSKVELEAMGYKVIEFGNASSGWTFSGSQYDVRGENYSSDNFVGQDWGWNDVSKNR